LPEPPDAPTGYLILVAGPSGAGKDTLIEAARGHFDDDHRITFWRRCITRADQAGEDHEYVSEADFTRMQSENAFFLSWEAHGFHYGIACGAHAALSSGQTVVVNVSRRIIAEAREKWPRTHVIYVFAQPEILSERLRARGREAADGIGARLQRGGEIAPPQADWVHALDNSGDIEGGSARFIALISNIVSASAERG